MGTSHDTGHGQEHQPTERTLKQLGNLEEVGFPSLVECQLAKQPD